MGVLEGILCADMCARSKREENIARRTSTFSLLRAAVDAVGLCTV